MTGPIFNAGAIEASARIDRTQFIADLQAMKADIAAFERNKINVGVNVDKNALKNALAGTTGTQPRVDIQGNADPVKRATDQAVAYVRTQRASVPLDADITPLDVKVGKALARLQELQRQKADPKVDLLIEQLEIKRDQVLAKLEELQSKSVLPKASLDLIKFSTDRELLLRQLDELNRKKASPEIDLKIATKEADLALLNQRLDELGHKKVSPEVVPLIEGQEAALKRVEANLERLRTLEASPTVDLKIENEEAKRQRILDNLAQLNRVTATPEVDAQIAKFEAKKAQVEYDIERLNEQKANPEFDAKIEQVEAKIELVNQQIRDFDTKRASGTLDLEIKAALANIEDLNNKIRQYSAKKASAKLDFDIAEAQMKYDAAVAERDKWAASHASTTLLADGTQAKLEMDSVEAKRRSLDGKTATFRVRPDTGTSNTLIAAIAAGISSIIYLAPAAGAALAALADVGGTALQTFGTLALGLDGVKKAYQAMAAQDQNAAIQVGVSHSGVESAERSLANTRTAAARAAIQSSQTVADAVASAARTEITSSRSVEDAKNAEAHTVETSNRTISDAQTSLTRALSSQADAIKAVDAARQQEIFTLTDLQLKLRGASLSETEAETALKKALIQRQLLNRDPLATSLQIEEQDEAVKRAQLTLDQAKQTYTETKSEADKAAAAGIEGSASVVAAKKQEISATNAVTDAQKNLDRAREDAAYQNQQAAKATATAIDNAAYANKQANEAVTDAIANQKNQQEQSAQSIADALDRVAEAQETAANTGVKANNRVQYVMSLLGPEAQKFAHFLYDEVRPALNDVGDTIDQQMLSPMQHAGSLLLTLIPDLKSRLGETGHVIGDLAVQGAKMATSGPFRTDFNTIMHTNNQSLHDFGEAGIALIHTITSLYSESSPLMERFSLWVSKEAVLFAQWIDGKRAGGELANTFQTMGARAKDAWDFIVSLAKTLYDLAVALAPIGKNVLTIVEGLSSLIQWLNHINPGILTLIGYLGTAAVVFGRINRGLLQAAAYGDNATDGFKKLGEKIAGLSPTVATYTEKITGSAAAGEKAATATEKIGAGVSKLGVALPIIGAVLIAGTAIWNHYVTGVDDAATAIQKGGAAAEQMTQKIQGQSAASKVMSGIASVLSGSIVGVTDGNDGLSQSIKNLAPNMDDVNRKIKEQRDALDPLTLAQQDATKAQNDYLFAVQKFGKDSPEAIQALSSWRDATKRATDQEQLLRNNLKSATDALNVQRDTMLDDIDMTTRFKDGIAQLTQQVRDHGKSVDTDTQAGRDNLQAFNELGRQLSQYSQDLQNNGATADQVRDKTQHYKDMLYQAGIQIGMTKQDVQDYINKLNLVPPNVNTNFTANIQTAAGQLQNYVNNINYLKNLPAIQTVLDLRNQIIGLPIPSRANGGIDSPIPMASGGVTRIPSHLATVINPNTPTLIGDHTSAKESFIPWNGSQRSHQIWEITGTALGRTFNSMANGGIILSGLTREKPNSQNTGAQKILSGLVDLQKFITGSSSSPTNVTNGSNNTSGPVPSFLNNIDTTVKVPPSISTTSSHTTNVNTTTNTSNTTGENVPVIGTAVFQMPVGADARDFADTLDFELKYRRKKGVYRR